jgi:twitching motility two-component system response regulator PilH
MAVPGMARTRIACLGEPMDSIMWTRPHNLLLVHDDPDALDLLVSIFDDDEYWDYTTAKNGQRALEISRAQRFDLAVLDINLPGRKGDSVCRLIKHGPRCAGTKIILISGLSSNEASSLLVKAGADAFIPKPFSPMALLGTVESLLRVPDPSAGLGSFAPSGAQHVGRQMPAAGQGFTWNSTPGMTLPTG